MFNDLLAMGAGGEGANCASGNVTISAPVTVTLDFTPTKVSCYATGASGSIYFGSYDSSISFNTYVSKSSSAGSPYIYTDGISVSGNTITFTGFGGNLAGYPLYYIATDE